VSLSSENAMILERALARVPSLMEADPDLLLSTPSRATFDQVVDCRTSIEIVERLMAIYADRPAIGVRKHERVRDEVTGQRVTRVLPAFETIRYGELWQRVERLASGLARIGVGVGDLVVLIGFSTLDHLVAELACHYLAAVSVPLARNVPARELEQIVAECQSTTLFCAIDQLARVAQSWRACPSIDRLIAMDLVQLGDEEGAEVDEAQRAEVEQVRASAGRARPELQVTTIGELERVGARAGRLPPVIPAPGTDPLLSLVYTSGSTGTPKGAMLGERSWHARWSTLPFLELTSLPMVSVVFLPQNHMGGRNAIANSLKVGGLAYLTHQSDMSTLFEDLRLVRPTYVHLVPRLSEMIYQHYQREVASRGAGPEGSDVVSALVMAEMRAGFLGDRMLLALTASAPTPPDVLAFVKRCFDIPVVNVFAGTEYGQLFIDGTVNRHNVLELKLVSVPELGYLETDRPYPRGELRVKTARGITHYYKNEQATRELFDEDGFLRTGDIFEQRGADEMVWIDRKNNVLKLAQGEFVNVWKIEAALTTGSRCIQQVYVYGSSLRSYLLAVVVPHASALEAGSEELPSMLRAELRRLASAHGLAAYELPRDFLVELEPFSRDNGLLTSLDKPARAKLKQKYGAALERKYEEAEARQTEAPGGPRPGLGGARDLHDAHDPRDARHLRDLSARLRRTFAAALGLAEPALEMSRSFREQGGDSIAGTNLRMLLQREWGVRIPAGALLGTDTSLAEVIAEVVLEISAEISAEVSADGGEPRQRRSAPGSRPSFERIHGADPYAIFARELRLERFFALPAVDLAEAPWDAAAVGAHVLLTGATGLLGRFLCLSLLERAAAHGGQVTAVVRARTDEAARRRLADVYGAGSLLQQRFRALAAERLHVLAGDLEAPRLGWSEERYAQLADGAEAVDAVIHAAAQVNHALPYAELFDGNVLSTAEVLRFCASGRRKRCNVVSTNSVSLALLGDRQVALESDDTRALGDGWPVRPGRHASGYRISKWAGEVLAQDLAERHGGSVNVFRSNLILPPARSRGQLNASDFFIRLIRSVVATGLAPQSFYERSPDPAVRPHLDGLPVDFLADAIVAIGLAPAEAGAARYAVYHLNNVHWGDGVSLDTVVRRLEALGYPVSRIEDHATWFQKFERALRALPPAQQASSSLPILAQWRAPIEMAQRQRIDASAFRARVQALRPGGLADIPALDDATFDQILEDLRDAGLLGR
jgi:fatty acid CoA ligase FadD9